MKLTEKQKLAFEVISYVWLIVGLCSISAFGLVYICMNLHPIIAVVLVVVGFSFFMYYSITRGKL